MGNEYIKKKYNPRTKEEVEKQYKKEEKKYKREETFDYITTTISSMTYVHNELVENAETLAKVYKIASAATIVVGESMRSSELKEKLQKIDKKSVESFRDTLADAQMLPNDETLDFSRDGDIFLAHDRAEEYLVEKGVLPENLIPEEKEKFLGELRKLTDNDLKKMVADGDTINGVTVTKEHAEIITMMNRTDRFHKSKARLKSNKRKLRYRSKFTVLRNLGSDTLPVSRVYFKIRHAKQAAKVMKIVMKVAMKSEKIVFLGSFRVLRWVGRYTPGIRNIDAAITDRFNTLKNAWKKSKVNTFIGEKKSERHDKKIEKAEIMKYGDRKKIQKKTIKKEKRLKRQKIFLRRHPVLRKTGRTAKRVGKVISAPLKAVSKVFSAPVKVMAKMFHGVSVLKAKIIGAVTSAAVPVLISLFKMACLVCIICIAAVVVASVIPGFGKGMSYENGTVTSMKDVYEKVLAEENAAVDKAVSDFIKGKNYDNVNISYRAMDSEGKWAPATSTNNVKQIVAMGSVAMSSSKKALDKDGKWKDKDFKKFLEYCSSIAKNSVRIKEGDIETTHCTENSLDECTNLKDDGTCGGHTSATINVYLYSYAYEGDYGSIQKKNLRSQTLFDIDDSFGFFTEIVDESNRHPVSNVTSGGELDEIAKDLKAEATVRGFALTAYAAKNDECYDKGSANRIGCTNRKLQARSEGKGDSKYPSDKFIVVSCAVDPDIFGKPTNASTSYFTIRGMSKASDGRTIVFRADDVGGAVMGKHIDIFIDDYYVPEQFGNYSIGKGGSYPASKVTIDILEKNAGAPALSAMGGNTTYFWKNDERQLAVFRCSTDWKELYDIDTEDYQMESLEDLKNNINKDLAQTFNVNTETLIEEKSVHIKDVKKEEENKASFTTKEYTDKYANLIEYTLLKWALSRKNKGTYSQDNRCMNKNPTNSASTDCSGFVSWVYAKTKEELGLTKKEYSKCLLWDNAGFSSSGAIHSNGVYTTATFFGNCNITDSNKIMPGDILIRRKADGTGHAAIFLGFTDKGYNYIDCNSGRGNKAVQVVQRYSKDVLSDFKGSGTACKALRSFDYEELNKITTKKADNPLFTTDSIIDMLGQLDTDYGNYKKKDLVTMEFFKWRKYKKYGGKSYSWKVSLD